METTLKLAYPFKPFFVTQYWGVLNPDYANHFEDTKFKRHNGIDATNYGNTLYGENWPIYCPVEGFVVEDAGFYEDGGGNQVTLLSKEKIWVGDKFCFARIYLLHGKKLLVKKGYEPVLGELLMIADNTGFSTGRHTHVGLYRLDDKLQKIDVNEATGSYNPEPFFTGDYAIDKAALSTLIGNGLTLAQYYMGIK